MSKFRLPNAIFIVKNEGSLVTMHNEHEQHVGLYLDGRDPAKLGYTVVAKIKVIRQDDAVYPGSGDAWIADLQTRAVEAFKLGRSSITV